MVGSSLMRIEKEQGRDATLNEIAALIQRAGIASGGVDTSALVIMAEMILERWGGRTANALRIMFRDGLNNGKMYGKLTYPVIAEWMNEHEAKVEEMNYTRHQATK